MAPGVKGAGYLVSILGMILGASSFSYILSYEFLIVQDTRPLHLLSALIFFQTLLIILWLILIFDAISNKESCFFVR
jgi:hypothetical protein